MEYIDLTLENNGGGGTSDHSQLSNLDYENSGHTGFMSNTNYLPSGTTITVGKTDADYTSIKDAIDSLSNKWSNGTVIISIQAGTYNINAPILFGICNIQNVIIQGVSSQDTILNFSNISNQTGAFNFQNNNSIIEICNLTIKNYQIDTNIVQIGIRGDYINMLNIHDIAFENFMRSIYILKNSTSIVNNIVINNSSNMDIGILSANGRINVSNITINNCTTGLRVGNGGTISLSGGNYTITNVINRYSQTINTFSGIGIIFGTITEL